jgi:hypothetical protein
MSHGSPHPAPLPPIPSTAKSTQRTITEEFFTIAQDMTEEHHERNAASPAASAVLEGVNRDVFRIVKPILCCLCATPHPSQPSILPRLKTTNREINTVRSSCAGRTLEDVARVGDVRITRSGQRGKHWVGERRLGEILQTN